MNTLKTEIQLLVNTIEPMRHKIKNLRSVAAQHADCKEKDEADACTKEANTLQIKMDKTKKELDVLMVEFETKQVAEWEARDAANAAAEKAALETANEETEGTAKAEEAAA